MSTSLVHVLKLIGPSARALAGECEQFRSRRVPASPRGLASDDWSGSDHQAIDALCDSLIQRAQQLPVVYAASYLDPWTVAGSSLHWFRTPDHRGRVWSDRWLVWYHALPDRGWLARRIAQGRRRRAYRRQAEDRWVLDHVAEAAGYLEAFNRPALVLVLSRAIAGSRDDDEYRRCLLDVR